MRKNNFIIFRLCSLKLKKIKFNENLFFWFKKFRQTFEFFIEKNVDINSQDEIGYSILHHAAAKNNFGAIQYILQIPGVNINVSF